MEQAPLSRRRRVQRVQCRITDPGSKQREARELCAVEELLQDYTQKTGQDIETLTFQVDLSSRCTKDRVIAGSKTVGNVADLTDTETAPVEQSVDTEESTNDDSMSYFEKLAQE